MMHSSKRWDEDHPYYVDELSTYFHTFAQARDALIGRMCGWDSLKDEDGYAFAYIRKCTKTNRYGDYYAKIRAYRDGNVGEFHVVYGIYDQKSKVIHRPLMH